METFRSSTSVTVSSATLFDPHVRTFRNSTPATSRATRASPSLNTNYTFTYYLLDQAVSTHVHDRFAYISRSHARRRRRQQRAAQRVARYQEKINPYTHVSNRIRFFTPGASVSVRLWWRTYGTHTIVELSSSTRYLSEKCLPFQVRTAHADTNRWFDIICSVFIMYYL